MGCHESKDKQIEHPIKNLHVKDPVVSPPETTSPPAPPAARKRGGMDGNVYGRRQSNESCSICADKKDSTVRWLLRAGEPESNDLPWDVMCVIFVKDLEKKKHLYRVEVKCAAGTKIAALQERVEWMIEFLSSGEGGSELAFSQSKVLIAAHHQAGRSFDLSAQVNFTAIVPKNAECWIDVARPEQTVGEVQKTLGVPPAEVSELATKSPDIWEYRGEQKKGLRFYATTGEPTEADGFAFWEVAHDGPNQPLLVTISNNLKVTSNDKAIAQ